MTPFRGAKFDGVRYAIKGLIWRCVHMGWVALMCESEPPGQGASGGGRRNSHIKIYRDVLLL